MARDDHLRGCSDANCTGECKDTGNVLVYRNPKNNRPVAVPAEVVAEADRPFRAYTLKVSGHSWDEISKLEGYPDAQSASYDVSRYLKEGAALVADQTRTDLLAITVARLDALMVAVWPAAMAGHLPSVQTAMNLVVNQAKLLQLDQLLPNEDNKSKGGSVVVSRDDYEASLRAVTR